MPSISPHKLSCTVNGGGAPCAISFEGEVTKTQIIARRLRALWTGAPVQENELVQSPVRVQRRG